MEENLFWWIIAIVCWLLAGYLGAKILNALTRNNCSWRKPARNSAWFGAGVLLGGITLASAVVLIGIALIVVVIQAIVQVILMTAGLFGYLTPKDKTE